jgi:hypothetical protein
VRLTVLLGLCLVALASCGGGEEKDTYVIRVPFISRSGDLPLEKGAPVRIDGKEVGEVAGVGEIGEAEKLGPPPHGTHMTVLSIEDEKAAPLPIDCAFKIESGAVEIKGGHSSETHPEGAIVTVKVTYPVP